MARGRGRPAKTGKRTAKGKLIPMPCSHDKGSAWVQAMRERFGEDYSTALGRAYAKGLLGEGDEAKIRYDNGRKFARAYRRVIGGDRYRCPLSDAPRGKVIELETERDRDDQEWLFAAMDRIDHTGCRSYLDQLVNAAHIDGGPYWLTALLDGGKHPADKMVLTCALRALDAIAGIEPKRVVAIRVAKCYRQK